MSAKATRTRLGFTLFEMIIVLVVLSLVFILVGVGRSPMSPTTEARAASRTITEALKSARSEAIAENRSVAFTLDVSRHIYRLDQRETHVLPRDLSISLMTSRDLTTADAAGEIRFDPDGGSSGGRISIQAGSNIWWIGVDWLSGRILLARKTA